jgi:hypothetical protein
MAGWRVDKQVSFFDCWAKLLEDTSTWTRLNSTVRQWLLNTTLSVYKSHYINYNTEVTAGSDVIEVGFIALRYHYKRQWISQMNDATSLIPNITWNKHNSHCWQYNSHTFIPGLVKKNVFRPPFLCTPHTINTTVQCYTSFQSKPNP